MPEPSSAIPSFANALGQASTDKRIEILRLVAQSGSISEAGRLAGVSYKAAWQAVDTLTNLAGVALVERVVGGAGGGGARVTPAGTALLVGAEKLDQARQQVLAALQSPVGVKGGPVFPGLLRTSMRNQFPCRVLQLQRHGQMARVTLQLAGGDHLVARITQASAELLALQPGQTVLALAKATAVRVEGATPEATEVAAENRLPGQVQRISRSTTGDEVAVEVAGGVQLVGFAAPGSGLKVRRRVWVVLDEAAIVMALTV